MTRFNRYVIDHPRSILAAFVLATVLFAVGIPRIEMELDIEALLPQDNPEVLYNYWTEDTFAIRPPAVFLVTADGPDGVFTPATLRLVAELSDALSRLELVDGEDVYSLSEVDDIIARDDSLEVVPFFEEPPATAEEARAVRRAVFDNPMMVGTIVSRDAKTTIVAAEVFKGIDKQALKQRLVEILTRVEQGDASVKLAGRPLVENQLGTIARHDLAVMFPIVIAVAALVLWLSLGCIRGVVLPMAVVGASVVWALGLMGWTHTPFMSFNIIIPNILVPIGLADGIHIIDHFLNRLAKHPELDAREATFDTMEAMAGPVVLTSVTTAVGLCSLASSPITALQTLGLFSAFGVMAAMVFSLTLLPALLASMKIPARTAARIRSRAAGTSGRPILWVQNTAAMLVRTRPRLIGAVSATVVLVSLAGIPHIVVDASLVRNFPPKDPVRIADSASVEAFGGSLPTEIVVEAERADDWKEPARLRALSAFQDRLERTMPVGETRSIADFIKRMNQVMHPSDPSAYRIPDDRNLIAQYLLLYSISGEPDDFDDVIDYDYRLANVRALAASDSSPVLDRFFKDVDGAAAELLAPHGLTTHGSGVARTSSVFMDLVIWSQTVSLSLAIVLIVILTSVLMRSVVAGVLTAIPVVMATLVNFGVLGWSGVSLGVTSAMVSSVSLGIGVDFAIHYVARYRDRRLRGSTHDAALVETNETAGSAILYNGVVVIAGFLVLIFSDFLGNRMFGYLLSLAMFVSLTATLTTLSAALYVFQPRFLGARGSSTNAQTDAAADQT